MDDDRRYCTQTLKIPFPNRLFLNTELTTIIPRSGDMIKRIRLVLDLPYANTDRESILEEAEFMVDGNVFEKIYGEFIKCENFFKTPLEKQSKLNSLLCTSAPGRVYLTLPFHSVERGFFLNTATENVSVRILLAKGQTTSEIQGYFLVDYVITEQVPEAPFFQRIRQIQKLSAFASSSNLVTLDTYFVGPVYELFFTVEDISTGNYVDAIESVTLWFNDRERFNLDGRYLRFIEPMKKYGRYSSSAPVYMYSFSLEEGISDVPSGQTNMPENQRFVINLYNNDANYKVTVWAQSHNFYYSNTVVFESTEMLLAATTKTSELTTIPMKLSYTNYANTLTVSYESVYPISNIAVQSTTTDYYTTPNQIVFSNIDSVNVLNYTTLTFSAQGFANTVCYISAIGSRIEYNYIRPNPDGVLPTYVDGGQLFHATSLGNLNAVQITSSNLIPVISMDQYRYFDLRTQFDSTLTFYSNSAVYATVPYTASSGPQQAIMKYDKDYLILWYSTVDNSNACLFTTTDNYFTSNVFGCSLVANASGTPMVSRGTRTFTIPTNETQGLVVASTFTSNITCGSSNLYVDSARIVAGNTVYVTGRTTASGDIKVNGSSTGTTSPAGGTAFLAKFTSNGAVSYLNAFSGSSVTGLETSLSVDANNNPIATYYTSTGLKITKYQTWTITINGLQTTSDGKVFNISKDVFDNTYIMSKYTSTTPTLTGHTFINGTGSALVKIDKDGDVRFAMSFTGASQTPILFIDKIIGAIFVNFPDTGTISVYREGTLLQSGVSTPVVLAIDADGNLFDLNTPPVVALSDFFTTLNNVYLEPSYDVSYFANPYIASISSVSATLGTFDGTEWSVNLSWTARDVTESNVYYHAQDTSTYTLWTQTTSYSNVFKATPDIWVSNTYSFKVEVNGVFNTPPLPFATTTFVLPKNPTYANVTTISTTLGTFANPYFPVTVDWSSAVDFLYANVYYHADDTGTWTFFTQKNAPTTSDVVQITPTIGSSNTYSFKVEVFNINNTEPLPFATTTQVIPKYPNYATITTISTTLGTFANPYFPVTVDWSSANEFLYANVYYHADDTGTWTFFTQKNAPITSNVVQITPTIGSSNTYSFKVEVFNINNTEPLPFATTTQVIPKYPDYATITTISTTLGTFANPYFPVTVDWSSAQDFAYANVYYQPGGSSTWTFYSQKNSPTTSNVVQITPTIGSSNTYSFKVEVFNTNNTVPLPFATTTQVIPKYPDYATITSVSTTLDTYAGKDLINVSWSATDFAQANVFYKQNTSPSYTFYASVTNTTSNIIALDLNYTANITYDVKVSVSNINNVEPLPFATTTQLVPQSLATYDFTRQITGLGTSAVATDPTSNVYFSGNYTGTESITDQANATVATLPNASGASAAFVAKFTTSNAYSWARILDPANNLAVGASNTRVFIAGYYTGTSSVLKNTADSTLATLARENPGYVVALDQNGAYQWNMLVDNVARCTSVLSTGYVGGYNDTKASNVYDSTGTVITKFAANSGFLMVFNPSTGVYTSNIVISNSNVYDIATDSNGNMYLAGYKYTTSAVGSVLPTTTGTTSFVAKYNSSSVFSYSAVLESSTGATSIAVSGSSLYFVGTCSSGAILKNTAGTTIATLPTTASDSAYLIKLDASSGSYSFVRLVTPGTGVSVNVDQDGSVYFAGSYTGSSAVLRDASGTITTLPNYGTGDQVSFLVVFDSSGVYRYSTFVDESSSGDSAQSVVTSTNRVYLSGYSS